ncbi:hypothetical protein NDU88_008924 [Pleurodeles waltl]|uniref:Uncharacterized protein n=1 Tax=Pleurodeles waltl TaxID=8319 RepID=A0AAV7P0P8_PLEWA|nr:hypothetical protein NDU88_008924 [Pleurodeles waltl]
MVTGGGEKLNQNSYCVAKGDTVIGYRVLPLRFRVAPVWVPASFLSFTLTPIPGCEEGSPRIAALPVDSGLDCSALSRCGRSANSPEAISPNRWASHSRPRLGARPQASDGSASNAAAGAASRREYPLSPRSARPTVPGGCWEGARGTRCSRRSRNLAKPGPRLLSQVVERVVRGLQRCPWVVGLGGEVGSDSVDAYPHTPWRQVQSWWS